MYSIQTAAEMLGKSERTVRSWMAKYEMELVTVITDRKRVYIAEDDMDILVDHLAQKVITSDDKTQNRRRTYKKVLTTTEGKYYSMASAATALGVAVQTIRVWVKLDEIPTKIITADRRRTYIVQDDLLQLAEIHGRKLSPKVFADVDIPADVNTTQPATDKLCSMKEAALLLGVTIGSIINWIRDANIEKKAKLVGRTRVWLTYADVLRLAELHHREVVPNPVSVEEAIKVLEAKVEKMASDIHDLRHDFRVYVRRSIYIGRNTPPNE